MSNEITLTPGYDPDKYPDVLCERSQKIRNFMSLRDYIIYINEKGRKSPLYKKPENENERMKNTFE